MINKIPELEKLELNQKNVMELLFKSKATPQTKKIIEATFYSKNSSRKAPVVLLDQDLVFAHYNLIRYWLGQIQNIHQQKKTLTPAAGIINYKGEKWTNDNRALFALYYLATSSNDLPVFKDGTNCAETPDLTPYYETGLRPTIAPSDPNFKLENARKALKNLGVKLPDDLSELD